MTDIRKHMLHSVLAIGLVGVAVTLTGCGGGGGGGSGTTTTTTTTTAKYEAPGACTEAQLHHGCAYGFCNATNNTCQCMPNYGGSDGVCKKPSAQKKMTFYMYRMQDDRNFTWANDDLASLSGVTWYLHNEVVVQSCPTRKFGITRVLRLKVTVFNTAKMFNVRSGMFGQFATFDSGFCHDCMDEIFGKYGFVVGCETPGASEVYNYGGYLPIWYSLPGECPSQPFAKKTEACKTREPGGQCKNPDGSDDCTWKYDYAGEVKIEDLYEKGFDYKEFCAKGGKEYDAGMDAGVHLSFWNDKKDPQRNAQRVQRMREVFQAKYPDTPDLPEPWCDWAVTPPIASEKGELVV